VQVLTHEGDVSGSGCSVSHWQNLEKQSQRKEERGQNLLQNGVINFAFRLSQSSGITFESWKLDRWKTYLSKTGLASKGLKFV